MLSWQFALSAPSDQGHQGLLLSSRLATTAAVMKTTLALLAAMLASVGSSTYGLDLAVAGRLVGNLRQLDEMPVESQAKDQPVNNGDFGGGKSYEVAAGNKEDFVACLHGTWNWPNCR